MLTPSHALLEQIRQIALMAGDAILTVYHSDQFDTQLKADDSHVTRADLAAHRLISSQLKQLFPDTPILSEEDTQAFSGANSAHQYWLVDPLDGTREFINRNDQFTVNIALISHQEPILGVVYAPALGDLYIGAQGCGAWLYQGQDNQLKTELNVTHERFAACHQASAPWRVLVSRSHRDEKTNQFLQNISGEIEEITTGSSLKFCDIAAGRAELYPRMSSISIWDIAAGDALLRAAGGWVKDLQGQLIQYPEVAADSYPTPAYIASGGEFYW